MEQPGLRIEERVNLDREGMGQDQIREFDMFLGEYESLVMEERGPEARWALGQWLRQSQHGAGLQDAAESIIADRCQGRSRGAHVFPLRREPADPVLRARLLRWTNCLCGLMANIYERGMLESALVFQYDRRRRGRGHVPRGEDRMLKPHLVKNLKNVVRVHVKMVKTVTLVRLWTWASTTRRVGMLMMGMMLTMVAGKMAQLLKYLLQLFYLQVKKGEKMLGEKMMFLQYPLQLIYLEQALDL